ncbi:MAG: peptide/nickel transport system substrate-binding protein [Frankiaceae bacterium]|nr:peptide/nickel transport system substrate-binding protein [Frankiaceae bacterium]
MRIRYSVRAVVVATAVSLALAGCTSSTSGPATSGAAGGTTAAGSDVIRLAFNGDMQVPDPDIFYELEGNQVVTSVYEGLIRYKPDSRDKEGAIAESWTVSKDGLTYTFKLRAGVKFHDGTDVNAAAAVASFKRRTEVNSAPAYMLADVVKTAAPDPLTFVVTLDKPVTPFLDYLASPYGPKLVSPKVLTDHAGSDFAQNWLKDHDGGTGPYTIAEFTPGTRYVLNRFDGYWGPQPAMKQAIISIIPDISTQRLQLEQGQLDMILHGLNTSDIESFRNNPKFQVKQFPVVLKNVMFVNENKGIFKDDAVRKAFAVALDKKSLVDEVYKTRATPSTTTFPPSVLPAGMGQSLPGGDPSKLQALVGGLASKKVDLAYSTDEPSNQRMAELIQTKLQAIGLDVTVRGLPIAQVFDLPNQAATAPDAIVTTMNPDAVHADTWGRIFNYTKGALNWLMCTVPAADAAMDAGLHEVDQAKQDADYGKAAELYSASGCWVDIADVQETVVARAGLTGFTHQLATTFTVRLADLKNS